MIKNDDLKTSPKQRIVILLIAVFMLFSTFALYAGIIISNSNSANSGNLTSAEQARYNELLAEYRSKVSEQAKELSKKYFDQFKGYKSKVKAFNAASVDNLKTEDLKIGSGKKVSNKDFTSYAAYYIGWLSDEKVFDSSFDDFKNPTQLKTPLNGTPTLIEGWKQGIVGMKMGGVRLLTIPSALAYGETGQGDTIPPNSPLKFIVMLIEPPEEVQVSDELVELENKRQGIQISPTETTEETTESTQKESSK